MSINIDYPSIPQVCGDANRVMVYGFTECHYKRVYDVLVGQGSPIKQVFCWNTVGKLPQDDRLYIEGRQVNVLRADAYKDKRICKNALANLVLENYKRKREGNPLIPCIFIADVDDPLKPPPDELPQKITSKGALNSEVRYAELRRIYKLCHDPRLPIKIRRIAQETFLFLKLAKTAENTYAFQRIQAPWEGAKGAEFDGLWKERVSQSKSTPKPPEFDWKAQLIKYVAKFDREYVPYLLKQLQYLEAETSPERISFFLERMKKAFIGGNVTSPRFRRRLALIEHMYQCLQHRGVP